MLQVDGVVTQRQYDGASGKDQTNEPKHAWAVMCQQPVEFFDKVTSSVNGFAKALDKVPGERLLKKLRANRIREEH
jgi:hypothetical protein